MSDHHTNHENKKILEWINQKKNYMKYIHKKIIKKINKYFKIKIVKKLLLFQELIYVSSATRKEMMW